MKWKKGVLMGAMRAHQRGMTLLEVVISMLVVALGLVMSISMIQTANRFGDTAEYTAFALQKSQLIIDTMRANVVAKDTYIISGINTPNSGDIDYNKLYNELDPIYNATDKGIVLSGLMGRLQCKSACTPAEVNAKEDVNAWVDEIINTLPGGRALIAKDREHYEVILMWRHVSATGNTNDAPVQGTRVWFTL